jgi:hypothetical protein
MKVWRRGATALLDEDPPDHLMFLAVPYRTSSALGSKRVDRPPNGAEE